MLSHLINTKEQTMITVSQIKVDGGTQMRAGLDEVAVREYAEAMANGWGAFPAVILYHDGTEYWLADGFHRLAAYRSLAAVGDTQIPADVRSGTRRDAILHAAGANADHGLRRTHADKRRAVEVMLRDQEWSAWSNREIARQCNVAEGTVRNIRSDLESTAQITQSTERHGADGRTINITNIGANNPAGLTIDAQTWKNMPYAAQSDIEAHLQKIQATPAELRDAFHYGSRVYMALERSLLAAGYRMSPLTTKAALNNIAAQRESASVEAQRLSTEIKRSTWGDPYIAVWEIQNALSGWVANQPAPQLRMLAKNRGGAGGLEVWQTLKNLHYRERDLSQALNNLANQSEQRQQAPFDDSRPAVDLTLDLRRDLRDAGWKQYRTIDNDIIAEHPTLGRLSERECGSFVAMNRRMTALLEQAASMDNPSLSDDGRNAIADLAGAQAAEPLPVLAEVDDRATRMQAWLIRLLSLKTDLTDWGDLTGHYTDTLALGRECDRLIAISQRELALLHGEPVEDTRWGMD